MGEAQGRMFEPEFNRSVKVEASDCRLTSDAGAVLLREFDHRLELTAAIAAQFHDPRDPDAIRYEMVELLRERIYLQALGYSVQDDADRLAHDPALRASVWDRPGQDVVNERLASQPSQSRFVTRLAESPINRRVMHRSLGESLRRYMAAASGTERRVRRATIDVDSFPILVHGKQHGAAYNGHYGDVAYHPLVASFCVEGNYDSAVAEGRRLGNGFLHAALRQGQVHTAHGIKRFVEHVVREAKTVAWSFDLRLDAGFTSGEVLDYLTDEKLHFVGRLKKNDVLVAMAEPHLRRPVGRPPKDGYFDLIELGMYQAESWRHPQRIVLIVDDAPDPHTGQLNLIPRFFFLVSNYTKERLSSEHLLEHYRQRGTFEDRLGEFQQAIGPHLSSPGFHENEMLLLLSLLAFNLLSFVRLEVEFSLGSCWDLHRVQTQVLKVGAQVVKHARRLVFQVAQAVRPIWERLQARLAAWILPPNRPPTRPPRSRPWVPPPSHSHHQFVLRL
jgi:hypothetical protein